MHCILIVIHFNRPSMILHTSWSWPIIIVFITVCSHLRGVDGLYLVLLKRSEAGHLAAQVRVNQHLIGNIWRGNNVSGQLNVYDKFCCASSFCNVTPAFAVPSGKWFSTVLSCLVNKTYSQAIVKDLVRPRWIVCSTSPPPPHLLPPAPLPCVRPAVCGWSPYRWGTSSPRPHRSAYPSAALRSTGLRVSEVMCDKRERGDGKERKATGRKWTEKEGQRKRGNTVYTTILKRTAHLLLHYNDVLAELNPFIWTIKTNRLLIHIIINHAAVVHRAEGHNNSLQRLTAESLHLCR